MNEGDDLLNHIRGFVHGRVHSSQEDIIVELVGLTVVKIMTTPEFYNHLVVIQQLQQENWNLRQMLIQHQKADLVRAQRAAARKAGAAAKKAAPRKAAAGGRLAAQASARPIKRSPTKKTPSSNVRSFMRGASGR